ncbi:MAG: arylsulfatase [Bacteroidales bacterium]|nr:MAG: arylsulfatase [Bacteroidales bacterium]
MDKKRLNTYLLAVAAVPAGMYLTACKNMPEEEMSAQAGPNIIYILADDLGYGDPGCYGQERIKTPNIDRLAEEGMRFTNHYAGSTVSAPSRCCLMTGMHTGKARIRGNKDIPLLAEDTTVAEVLTKSGYVTALFGKWGLGELGTPGHPNDKGFSEFIGYLDQTRAHNAYTDWMWHNKDTLRLDNKVELIPVGGSKGVGSVALEKNTHTQDVFTDKALKFIEKNKDTSFFMYLSYTLPHANNEAWYWNMIGMEVPDMMGYDTVSGWSEAQQAFAASISYLDQDIGKIILKLKQLGIEKNTLVIFSSDNGPHKEGGNDPEISKSSGPLRGIKRDLYEGGIRVPMIAYWPGKIDGGSISDHISAFWDFLPTVCDILKVNCPRNTDGISFLPALLGEKQMSHKHLYWEFYERNGKQAVRMGKWKAVRLNMDANPDAPVELYDLSEDIGEKRNLAEEYPEIIEKMEQIMKKEHIYSEEFSFTYERGQRPN